jgi:hypothetical protein
MRQLDKLSYEARIKDGLITVSKDEVVVFVARGKGRSIVSSSV